MRRGVLLVLATLALYALCGFFLVPALLHRWIDGNAARLLGRPVSVGAITFNPFTRHLRVEKVRIAEVDGVTPFAAIERIDLALAWAALWQRAPLLDALDLTHPRLALVRTGAWRFNVSDLIDKFGSDPVTDSTTPLNYSMANIRVQGGEVRIDDKVGGSTHTIADIDIGIPLLANRPRAVSIGVSPLFAARVDGRPLRIAGEVQSRADSLESFLDLTLERLDLPQYLAYAQSALPVAMPRGTVSGNVRVHVVQGASPRLRLDGVVVIDDAAMTEKDGAPIAEAARIIVSFSDVQPLLSRYRLGSVNLDHAHIRYVARAGGRSNVDGLFAYAKPAPEQKSGGIAIDRLGIVDGQFDYVDETLPGGATTIALESIDGSVAAFDTRKGHAEVELQAQHNGGEVRTDGQLDMASSRYTGTLTAKNIGMAPLQPYLVPRGSTAVVRAGRVDTTGRFYADWKAATTLRVEPATLRVRDLALGLRGSAEPALTCTTLDLGVQHFDWQAAEVRLDSAVAHGLVVRARIARDGSVDLARLLGESPATAAKASGAVAPAWHWGIARFAFEAASARLDDARSVPPRALSTSALSGEVSGLGDAMDKPLALTLAGSAARGTFTLAGTLGLNPLDLDVKATTREFDLLPWLAYAMPTPPVRIDAAVASSDGTLHYTPQRLDYHGRASVSPLRLLDPITGDELLAVRALRIGAIEMAQAGAEPARIRLGDVALEDFHARLFMNADGSTNVGELMAANAASAATKSPAAALQIGPITLQRGHLNVSDNYIKPNYSADITELAGRIGAFASTANGPAEVELAGLLDANTRVDIRGRIDPLAARAMVDVRGNAQGVELTRFSAYAVRYTGYPIIKGRLNASVHYLLDGKKLTADNHFNIEQLTFGEESHEAGAGHQPVKLAVSLLKDANGVIDVNVPVSGSLDDPKFSLGGMLWRAFGGMIGKAASAPFRLLASAFKREQGAAELAWIEFAPGADQLDAAAQAKLADIARIANTKAQLNIGIIGRTDPALDATALRRVTVDAAIRREYAREHNIDEAQVPAELSTEETEAALALAYRHADVAKERRLLVLPVTPPVAEMRRLLEARVATDDSAMLHLAERRAGHVVGFLHGKVDDRRLWTLAPQLRAQGIDDKGKTTRVEMTLK